MDTLLTVCELLSNMSQVDGPTPLIRTEIEPFTSCVISLVQYVIVWGTTIFSFVTYCFQTLVAKATKRFHRLISLRNSVLPLRQTV